MVPGMGNEFGLAKVDCRSLPPSVACIPSGINRTLASERAVSILSTARRATTSNFRPEGMIPERSRRGRHVDAVPPPGGGRLPAPDGVVIGTPTIVGYTAPTYRPDALIVYVGHNEFQARFSWQREPGGYYEDDMPALYSPASLAKASQIST